MKQGGDPDDADAVVNVEQEEADEQIKEDFAQMLDPTLISYSDLLMKRFDNRMDAMFNKVCSKYGEAMDKAQAAEERAARAKAAAEEAKTATSELKETVEDQGKHLAELEKQFRDLAAKSRGVLSGKESYLGVSSKCSSLASSTEGRLVKMQKAYMDLVARDGEDQGLERLGADRSGLRTRSERFTEQIGAENSQGCSAPLRSGAATCNPPDQEALLHSVNRSIKNQTLTCQNSHHELINWLFCSI